jgi:very-short-patch-repair endonuclease
MELELATKLESSGIQYQTQVEVAITTADFYFATEPRPTLVFVDGRPHLTSAQMIKDEELRTLLRKRGYKVVELAYSDYSDKRRDELYSQLLSGLGRQID